MKAKVLFLMLFCILFLGCSNDEDSAPSYIGCWYTIAQENNGKWDTDPHHIACGIITLRDNGQYYSYVDPWTANRSLGYYQAYGDSLVFYDFRTPELPRSSCRILSLNDNELVMRLSRPDKKKTYKIKFERREDTLDYDFMKSQLENPITVYPK